MREHVLAPQTGTEIEEGITHHAEEAGPGLVLDQVIVVGAVAGTLGTREVPAAVEAHLAHFLPVLAPPLPLALPILPPMLYLTNRESLKLRVVKRRELPKSPKLTPQEKLKLRMQKALNKQCKADKKAAQVKIQQQENKRQEREGVLRAMARKIRMKERERREKERDEWERQYGRQSHSPSPSSKSSRDYSSHRRRSRSKSRSPHYRY